MRFLNGRSMVVVDPRHHQRSVVETFIFDAYRTTFKASLAHYLPKLVATFDERGSVVSAFGFRPAWTGRLFLESYLDLPVEAAMGSALGRAVERLSVVEIGNLAVVRGAFRSLLVDLGAFCYMSGFDWIVCTATARLHRFFDEAGMTPVILSDAPQHRAPRDGTHWGNYYSASPRVVTGNIRAGMDILLRHGVPAPGDRVAGSLSQAAATV